MRYLRLLTPMSLLLLLGACALFQQIPGRATNGAATTEAGAVWGKTISVPGACPSIEFMGAQNIGKITALCSDNGANQSVTAETVDANSVLQSAINGQTALGQQAVGLAQTIISTFGAAGKVASGGLGVTHTPSASMALSPQMPSPTVVKPGVPCPPGTVPSVITAIGTACNPT